MLPGVSLVKVVCTQSTDPTKWHGHAVYFLRAVAGGSQRCLTGSTQASPPLSVAGVFCDEALLRLTKHRGHITGREADGINIGHVAGEHRHSHRCMQARGASWFQGACFGTAQAVRTL